MISIYKYLDPAEYINDKFNELKDRRSNYSLRAWARDLGLKSHGPLHAILKSQRNIPITLIPALIKTLKLTKEEAKYFEVLVDFQRAKTAEEKNFYKDKLDQVSPVPLREINDVDAYKVITDPFHIALAEMSQLKVFKEDPAWLKSHLRVNQNMRDLEMMLERLIKLGVIEKKGSKFIKPIEHIYTKYEIESSVVQNYHRICSEIAMEQISKQKVEDREFNTIAFNIEKKNLPAIKEKMRAFINDIVETYEAPAHKGDETYQLNMHFFSLTKKK